MPEKTVLEKLLYRSGARAAIVNPPAGYAGPPNASESLAGTYDFVQFFTTRKADLVRDAGALRQALAPNAILWISYPKAKALNTDLNRDIVRTTLQQHRLEVVSQVAIDGTWSALRAKPV